MTHDTRGAARERRRRFRERNRARLAAEQRRWREVEGQRSSPERIAAFWQRVDVGRDDECWPWLGATHCVGGHGVATMLLGDVVAHRIAWKLLVPYVPIDGLELHHGCTEKRCCNPCHLWPMSKGEHATLHHAVRRAYA